MASTVVARARDRHEVNELDSSIAGRALRSQTASRGGGGNAGPMRRKSPRRGARLDEAALVARSLTRALMPATAILTPSRRRGRAPPQCATGSPGTVS